MDFKKNNINPFDLINQIKELKQMLGDDLKISVSSVNIASKDFPDQIKIIEKKKLQSLLKSLIAKEDFSAANVVQREMERRGGE